jgi:predicted amidophosphoribosyltransferase
MFCFNCGKEIADKVNFCPNCGVKIAKDAGKHNLHSEPSGQALNKLNAEIEKSFPVHPDTFDKTVHKVKKRVKSIIKLR